MGSLKLNEWVEKARKQRKPAYEGVVLKNCCCRTVTFWKINRIAVTNNSFWTPPDLYHQAVNCQAQHPGMVFIDAVRRASTGR